jgi:hypothetical protein
MSDPYSISITSVESNQTGTELTVNFLLRDASGDVILTTEDIFFIRVLTGTSDVDGFKIEPQFFSGSELVQEGTVDTLINSYTFTGLTNAAKYSTTIVARYKSAPSEKPEAKVNSWVRGGGQNIQTVISSYVAGDGYVQYQFNQSVCEAFETAMQIYDSDFPTAHMFAFTNTNDSETGFNYTELAWTLFKAAGYKILVSQTNGLECETFGGLASVDLNDPTNCTSIPSYPGTLATAIDTPNAPTDVASVSTFEYNRDTTADPYDVTNAKTVTILFNPAAEILTPAAQYYSIYRCDLSNNGYTVISDSCGNIGRVDADTSGNYTYDGETYSYLFTDLSASVLTGNYYGYQISGTNANGEGPLSSLFGVLDGSAAAAPTMTLNAGNESITVNLSANGAGGFQSYSPQLYTIYYSGSDASGYITQVNSPYTIENLSNGVTYSVTAYTLAKNVYYTTPGTVVTNSLVAQTPIQYVGNPSLTQTATPRTAPIDPTNVSAAPEFDASGVPNGHNYITWTSDTSFNGYPLSFQIYAYDASTNAATATSPYTTTYSYDDSSNLIPSPQYYSDADVTLGTEYYYTVAATYDVVPDSIYSTAVRGSNTNYYQYYSPALAQAGNVVPFEVPSIPNLANYYFDNSSQFFFELTANSGNGLAPVQLHATVSDASSGYAYFDQDVLSGAENMVALDPNTTIDLSFYAFTVGPNPLGGSGNYDYSSNTITDSDLGPSTSSPVITIHDISGGVLTIGTNNNGNALNFVEGLILDSSSVLQVSYITSANAVLPNQPIYYPNNSVISIDWNNDSSGQFIVTFPDANIEDTDQLLIVAANSAGADVYNTISENNP